MKMKKIISLICIALLAVVTLLILKLVDLNDSKNKTNYNDYEKEVVEIATDYYESIFYKYLENPKEDLKTYKDYGIRFSLDLLNAYVEFSADTSKYLVDKECNYDKSVVVIKPHKSYSKTSYKTGIDFVCNK